MNNLAPDENILITSCLLSVLLPPRKNESVHLSFTLHQSYHTPLCLSGVREVKVARRTFTQPSPLTRMDSYLPMIRVICRIKFLGIEKWSDIVHNDNRWRCLSYYLSDINRFIRYLIYLSETLDISLLS